jgi:hypothetical protein
VDGHVDAIGVEDQRRVSELRAPAGLDEPAADVALPPDTAERGELVMVRAAGSQAPVDR